MGGCVDAGCRGNGDAGLGTSVLGHVFEDAIDSGELTVREGWKNYIWGVGGRHCGGGET